MAMFQSHRKERLNESREIKCFHNKLHFTVGVKSKTVVVKKKREKKLMEEILFKYKRSYNPSRASRAFLNVTEDSILSLYFFFFLSGGRIVTLLKV